jgi:multidrug efflux system membrane fusion protein
MEIMLAQEKDSTMKTRNYILHTSLAAFLLLAAGCGNKEAVQAAKPAAAPVRVATVASRTMPVELQAIGNVEAISAVSIKAQISGQLVGVHFKEGDFVKKGQLLFTIERPPFEAALRQAEGTLAKDEAQSLNSKLDAERYQGLGREGVVSKQQVDAAGAAGKDQPGIYVHLFPD